MPDRNVKVILSADVAAYKAAFEQASDATRKTREEASKARDEADKLAAKKQAFQDLGKGLLVVGGAMTALAVGVAKTGIEYNVLQQTSRAALKTLLGGAEAANAQMDKLNAFARTSPFAKTTFIQAQQQMLAFGIETKKVIPYLDALQDAVAAAGGGNQQLGEMAFIMAQISAAGKITAEDLMQFGQRGVNAAELIGSQMGKTGAQIRDEITKGSLGADAALDALAKGMKERFGGAAANVKLTFEGAMDRVKAAWRDLSADLLKPLVDPNGGGALVDLLNWAADVMRAFQQLPEPIKNTTGVLFAVVGVVALVGGAILLAVPKILAMVETFKILSASGREAMGRLGGFVGFLGGPWGIAMLAATAALMTFNKIVEESVPKQAEIANALRTSASAADGLQAAFKRGDLEKNFMGDYAAELKDLPGLLDHAIAAQSNWADALSTTIGQRGAYDSLAKYGEALAGLAQTSIPQATSKFRELVDSYKLTDAQAMQLLKEMPAFRDELLKHASDAGIAADSSEFLALALGKSSDATTEHAQATKEATQSFEDEKKAADDLKKQLDSLLDTINAMNGLNQSVEATNARYQKSLVGITEEVQRQQDAYEKVNGTLDGFSLSLDANSASGSANRSMLSDVAKSAQDAADAQLRVDRQTMSAKDAADRYQATLAAQKQAFIDSAVSAGFNADEVQKLADKVFALPPEKLVKLLADTGQAQAAIDQFVTLNDGRRVKVFVDAEGGQSFRVGSTTVSPANANGAIYEKGVKKFAAGGFAPGIYPYVPGGIHKFAEEYDEAYISGDPARKARSEAVWVESGRRFGFSDPSSGNTSPASSTTRVEAPINIKMFDRDPRTVAKQIGRGIEEGLHG